MKIKHLDISREQKRQIDKETDKARNQEYNEEKYLEDYHIEELKLWKKLLKSIRRGLK